MPAFTCGSCGKDFEVAQASLDKYPGWTPKKCLKCKGGNTSGKRSASAGTQRTASRGRSLQEENLTLAEVLAKYDGGPESGVFTDGASHPNPGPGGWGAVYVVDGQVKAQSYGHEPDTTNNRMELTALIEGCKLVPPGESATVWSDSQLCVNTLTQWAAGWKRNGWKRKGGEIKNLPLVQEAYALYSARPELTVRWINAHSGNRWNEYADALATAYRRPKL